jgi:hypothetical protein
MCVFVFVFDLLARVLFSLLKYAVLVKEVLVLSHPLGLVL